MSTSTKAERQLAHEQALASTRIDGHVPTPEFLADCQAVIEGTMSRDEARAASLARALAMDKAAAIAAAGINTGGGQLVEHVPNRRYAAGAHQGSETPEVE